MRFGRDCCVPRGDEAETSEQTNRDVELWEGDAELGDPKELNVSLSYGWCTDWRRNAGRQREAFGFVPFLHDEDNKGNTTFARRSLYALDRTFHRHSNLNEDIFNQRFVVSHSGISYLSMLQHSALFSFLFQHGVSLVTTKFSAI